MIGNDVIDLVLAKKESNWKRKGFLDKIFTEGEQLFISKAENSETMVWNLWSRKEAAYKIYNRQTGIRAFIPRQLECFDLEKNLGKVICNGRVYFTKTTITSDCIETVAVTDVVDFDNVKFLNATENLIKINGVPNYLNPKSKVLHPVSKSHHGKFESIVKLNP